MNDDEPEPGRGSEHYPAPSGAQDRSPADPAARPPRRLFDLGTGLIVIGLLASTLGVITAVSTVGWLAIAAAGCLVLAFSFALFENALEQHSYAQLRAEAKRREVSDTIDGLLEHEDEILFTSKIGRGLAQIAAIALVATALVASKASVWGVIGWTTALASTYLVVHVVAPFLLGRRVGHLVLLRSLRGYNAMITPLKPMARALRRFAGKLTGAPKELDRAEELTDELHSVLEEGTREGTLQEVEKEMIEGVMDLRDVTAEHVMTPRTELICVPVDASIPDAIAKSQERGLSRLPIYRGTPDDIVGVLYVKDLLAHWGADEPPTVESIKRQPFFVPASKNVGDLLAEMQSRQIHLAVVLDEYGGTAGVVSIEDILEEIVGEIADEHEEKAQLDVVRIHENAATVEGRAHIDDLNESLDIALPESDEFETVGGLLFSRLGRVPSTGESYEEDGVRFTVLDADERRVHRVKVTVQRASRSA